MDGKCKDLTAYLSRLTCTYFRLLPQIPTFENAAWYVLQPISAVRNPNSSEMYISRKCRSLPWKQGAVSAVEDRRGMTTVND
jgi:hypothetical protein